MSHLLIIGRKFSGLIQYIEDQGHTYTLLQDARKTKFPSKKFRRRVVVSFKNKQGLLASVDRLKKRPDAAIAVYENYVLPAAWISEHLNILGMPVPSAMACTDKELMREAFSRAPEKISPDFTVVNNEQDLSDFAASHRFPMILKPANLAKSLLVTKNHSLEELLENYKKSMKLIHGTYEKYATGRDPKLLVEEFLEGSIHSVEAFVDSEGEPHVLEQVVDYQTGYDIGFDDNFHYSRILPSQLSDIDRLALRHCAQVGIRALGMKNSPAHVEIIMTPEGPRIVEIGARNGGYRERMHLLANGIDITGAALATFLGKKPDIKTTKNENVAVLELFPKEPGIFSGIENEEELRKLPSLNYISVKAKPGALIGKSSDGHKMAAVVILHNPDKNQFLEDLDFVTNKCQVKTNTI